MSNKLSDKDKKAWQNFLLNKEKLKDKDLYSARNKEKNLTKKIDLHGYSLDKANIAINNFINECFQKKINKIIVITGKGLRSKNDSNPYVSKDLSILKYSVPEYIKSNQSLMKMIKEIKYATIDDGGSGAFYIYLKI